ncbi:putative polyketide hydroxylase [Hibiscus syriacus]|uniref:putative polyketide hydroxylase n=1 Tax=Hibiscus syriacus TaxID=106335 RepID=UPI0019244C2E|nr:putative polyketide hydroxylase [Hibiscus syriacus]
MGPGGPGGGPGGPGGGFGPGGPGGPWGPGFEGPGGPGGFGPGPGGPWGPGFGGLGVWPGGFFGGFADGLCNMISSCFYCLCCCWLLQDCFGGLRGYGPPPF